MKTAKQIIDAINEFYRISIECPPGCFRNLEGMEDQLCLLESIYEFILDDSNERIPGNNGFGKFLFDNDYGTLGYCYGKLDEDAIQTRLPMKAPTDEEVEKMKALGEFWKQYLSSERRLRTDA